MGIVELDGIIERYSGYYYPVILINRADLKVVYKNEAAKAAKMKARVGVHIKKYLDEKNLQILETENLDKDREDRIVELKTRPSRCVARISGCMIILLFFDSLNLMQECSPETAQKIAEITAKYDEQKLFVAGKDSSINSAKAQKIRTHFDRYIANLMMDDTKRDFLHTYCDVREFLCSLETGILPVLNSLGYQISFDAGRRDDIFVYWLNESDFLALNFILISYALTRAIFGVLEIRFESSTATLIYEFMSSSAGGIEEQEENIDLELAKLIAKNNNLGLSFYAADDSDNLLDRKSEGKVRIAVRFIVESDTFYQQIPACNIISADFIAERAKIEFAELINLYNM